jgi:hypothetical protein
VLALVPEEQGDLEEEDEEASLEVVDANDRTVLLLRPPMVPRGDFQLPHENQGRDTHSPSFWQRERKELETPSCFVGLFVEFRNSELGFRLPNVAAFLFWGEKQIVRSVNDFFFLGPFRSPL